MYSVACEELSVVVAVRMRMVEGGWVAVRAVHCCGWVHSHRAARAGRRLRGLLPARVEVCRWRCGRALGLVRLRAGAGGVTVRRLGKCMTSVKRTFCITTHRHPCSTSKYAWTLWTRRSREWPLSGDADAAVHRATCGPAIGSRCARTCSPVRAACPCRVPGGPRALPARGGRLAKPGTHELQADEQQAAASRRAWA